MHNSNHIYKMESIIICPVCTLFLRPGITLKTHLSTHPKQKVIDALVKLTEVEPQPGDNSSEQEVCSSSSTQPFNSVGTTSWNGGTNVPGGSQIPGPFQGNHLFIYQQSMSTSQTNTLNPLAQQYIIPAVVNPQMMPYVYQQQQLIMSSGSCLPQMRLAPFELACPPTNTQSPSICSAPRDIVELDLSSRRENENVIEVHESEPEMPVVNKEEVENDIQIEEINKLDSKIEEVDQNNEIEGEKTENIPVTIEECQSETQWNPSSSVEDLNKACQTSSGPTSSQQSDVFQKKDYYYLNNESESAVNYSSNVQLESIYEQQNPIYTSTNILQSTEHLDFVEVDGVQVIIGDFATNSIISQVDNFENVNERNVLLNIGEMSEHTQKNSFITIPDVEESVSRCSTNVNIRADERMPPRGELSGQESLGGASDINWNRLHYNEGSSGTSYDLLGRETWEDSSDVDCPLNEEETEIPSVVSYIPPALNFKCSHCEEAFSCLQDRKQHSLETHLDKEQNKSTLNIIGSQIGKNKVKKLVVKLKSETETAKYDTVFTNKIKVENGEQLMKSETLLDEVVKTDESAGADSRTICSLCNAVLPNARALKEHRTEIHNIRTDLRFKCSTCDTTFPNEYRYNEHLKEHPLECKLCGKLFYRRQNIQLHMKRHLGIKPYKCDICQKSFLTKQKMEEHRNVHTGNAPIKCTLCNESFRRHSNLVQHRNRHHLKLKKKVKDYVCHCGEYFHSRKKLAWHKEIHDSKPKACTMCSEKFIHLASLTRHMRKAHNERYLPKEERSNENVECPICKGVFIKSSLEVHIRSHSGARPFSCLICNKDFTTRWNLKLHKWTHASRVSKPFKCDQCNGAFFRESDYVSHMNSHKSIKPYTCNYCGARFIRKYNCQRHVKEHENDKTYSCTVCNKSFHRSYYLKDHMRVHSGVRPFTCHVCGKTSTTKSNHNKHVQIHHAREPVSTEN